MSKRQTSIKNIKETEIKETERTIYAIGRPDLKKVPKTELKIFYDTLLSCVLECFKKNKPKERY